MTYKKMWQEIASVKDALLFRCEFFEDRMNAIEEKASEHDRDMTKKEQERYDYFENEKYECEEIIDSLYRVMDDLQSVAGENLDY